MKQMLCGIGMLLCLGLAARAATSELPLGRNVFSLAFTEADLTAKGGFPSPPYYTSNPGPYAQISFEELVDEPTHYELKVKYTGSTHYPLQLFNFGEDMVNKIHGSFYAIVGEVRCENVAAGSYLEMNSYFGSPFPRQYPEAGEYSSRSLEASGPMGTLEGTQAWREFWLPFDSSHVNAELNAGPGVFRNIVLNLQLSGEGTVFLRKMRLVSFSSNPIPMAKEESSSFSTPKVFPFGGIHARSFFLGAVTILFFLFGLGGIAFLWRRLKRKKHELELRRIASLDS